MPATLPYRPTLMDELTSVERLQSYIDVFAPANDVELMGVYLWNSQVVGALYPLISAAEIALRNAINFKVTGLLGRFWWTSTPGHGLPLPLQYKSIGRAVVPAPIRNIRQNFAKASSGFVRDAQERRGAGGHVSLDHNGVVSKTDFSTWQFMLDQELQGRGLIWPSLLGQVFRGPWGTSSPQRTRQRAHDLTKEVREFRNRMFHHEPAWKRYGVASPQDAIALLHEKLDRIEQLISLIHPDLKRMLNVNGQIGSARRAMSLSEIRRLQHLVKARSVKTITGLQAVLAHCENQNASVSLKVYRGNRRVFLISPIG